jgi:beta-1,4-N-acetylglucosaminyltransferase
MLSVLRGAGLDFGQQYNRRTYVVSSGDAFSAKKAIEFEKEILLALHTKKKNAKPDEKNLSSPSYGIVIVPRARKVHQSFLTAPWTTLHCLLVCLHVLQGRHPNQHWVKGSSTATTTAYGADYPGVILTNGPGTAVCVIVAARILRLLNILLPAYLLRLLGITPWHGTSIAASGQRRYLRTVFVESWARVTTLSLSGKIVLPMVDRFLVQWEPIAGYRGLLGGKTEFAGTLVC